MQFYVDIEDAAGNKLGTGPIQSATGWQVRRQMDKAGDWSFTAPLSDTRLAQATPRRYAHIYAYLNGVYQWVGGGPIDSIATTVGADGVAMATVSGSDMVRELAWRTVGALVIANTVTGAPITHTTAVFFVSGYAPDGWLFAPDSAPPHNEIYGQFNGESVLAAMANVAARTRTHFYLSDRRLLTFKSTFTDSGVQAVQARGDLAAGTTAIVSLTLDQSSHDLYSRIIPTGAGQSHAQLTLRATSRTAGAGYTLDAAANVLTNDGVESAYGRSELTVNFREIAPISNTTADVIYASNALFDSAEYWLQQHAQPVTSYKVSVVECPTLLLPLQTLHVSYRDPDSGIDIDDDLKILGVEWQGDTAGVRTAGLTVADSGQWPASDVQAVVESMASGHIYQAHPQLNANAYVLPFSKNLDDVIANPAEFRFRFDQEVTQLNRVCFDFQLLPLESTVKTIASASTTTGFAGNTPSATLNTPSMGTTNTPSMGTANTPSMGTTNTPSTTFTSDHPTGHDTVSGGRHVHGVDVGTVSSPDYANVVYFKDNGDNSQLYARNTSSGFQVSGRVPTTTSGDHTHNIDHVHNIAHLHDIAHLHSIAHTHDIAHLHDITHNHTFTPTINTLYGVYRDSPSNRFVLSDLEYSVDNTTWYSFAVGVNGYTDLGDDWHRIDITGLLQDPVTLRPLNANNLLQIRRQAAGTLGKLVTIDAQLSVRTIIQAIALTT